MDDDAVRFWTPTKEALRMNNHDVDLGQSKMTALASFRDGERSLHATPADPIRADEDTEVLAMRNDLSKCP